MKCKVPECPDDSRSKGMCQAHYYQHWRHGSYMGLMKEKWDSSDDEMLRAYRNHPNVLASLDKLAAIADVSRHCVAKAVMFK